MAGDVALDADDPHVERTGETRDPRADSAEPVDNHGLAGQFLFATIEIGNHAAPDVLALSVAPGMNVTRQCEQQRHRMVAHRVAVDAAAVGEPHPEHTERIKVELVVARRAHLD